MKDRFTFYPGYNEDIFGPEFTSMTDEEIALTYKVYDAIIASLLPEWASWCGDKIICADNAPADEVEEFDINDILADACEILWSRELDVLAAQYLSDSTDD